jgi:nitronate monooxygenase
MHPFIERLGLRVPILQAPMAGVSTPALAAAVTQAGGLGALGLGAMTVDQAEAALRAAAALTTGPINANLFCHQPVPPDPARNRAWIAHLAPAFAEFGAAPPEDLFEIYQSFRGSRAMLDMLLALRPAVVSLHFGLPEPEAIAALKAAGIVLLASATSAAEARAAMAAGIDAVVAQGWEAGGHRGLFDPDGADERLGTFDLLPRIAALGLPVIAAGGLMTGADIARAERLGAAAAQLGTAFVACPESAADTAYRAALGSATEMTRAISGRPARGIANRFTALGDGVPAAQIAPYPYAYDAGKALNAAARAQGETGFSAQWAGTGAACARPMPAADLVALLARERG